MSERVKIAEFVSFCIEMFAKAKRLSGDKVAAIFQSCGAIDYLERQLQHLGFWQGWYSIVSRERLMRGDVCHYP